MQATKTLAEHFRGEYQESVSSGPEKLAGVSPIVVLQWNILAGGLSDQEAFPLVPLADLQMQSRLPKIIKYLKHPSLQFICLEEVDVAAEIQQALGDGWGWIYAKKPTKIHGVLLGYKTNPEFEWVLHSSNIDVFPPLPDATEPSDRCYIHAVFNHKTNSTAELHVFGTHMKAKKKNEAIRVRDIQTLLPQIKELISTGKHVLFLADFNAEPEDESVKLVLAEMKKTVPTNTHTTAKYHSETDQTIRQIDYIFHSKNMHPIEAWAKSTHPLKPSRLPDDAMPSDHLPIFARLELLKGPK